MEDPIAKPASEQAEAEADETAFEADETAFEADETASEGDETASEGDETAFEGDETAFEGEIEARHRQTRQPSASPQVMMAAFHFVSRDSPLLANAVFLFSLALALALALARTQRSSTTTTTTPSEPEPDRTPPAIARIPCQTITPVPLSLLDELADLIVLRANAPLPLIVIGQQVVDQHYAAHGAPPRSDFNSTTTPPITAFFAQIYELSNALCDAATDWAISNKSSIAKDALIPLCAAISRSALDVPQLWAEVTADVDYSWSSPLLNTLRRFVKTLRQYESSAYNEALSRPADSCFYNTTSYAVLEQLSLLFFNDTTQPGGGATQFSEVAYSKAHAIGNIRRAFAALLARLSLLSSIVRDIMLPISKEYIRSKPTRSRLSWLSRPHPPIRQQDALANIAPRFERLLPIINTATTLVWIVAFAHTQVQQVVDDLERLGNQTQTLLTVPPSPNGCQLPQACISFPGEAWHAKSWVAETNHGAANGSACVVWYLPSIGSVITSFENLTAWLQEEVSQSEEDFTWLMQAEQTWNGY
ncbi:hypothetical protein K4K48_007289 [Colletotrichum sp. SAR 10_66]|nr:hypothetical protein K4K48_007289 [Colletotrichum sp. SAR 10_66]